MQKTPLYIEDLLDILSKHGTFTAAGYMGTCHRVVDHDGLVQELIRAVQNPAIPNQHGIGYNDDLPDGWVRNPDGTAAPGGTYAFPPRDLTKPAEQQGIFEKFTVRRNDGSDVPGGKHEGCAYFVLDLDHDPHASAAMLAYAASCRATHPQLADDIEKRYSTAPAARTK